MFLPFPPAASRCHHSEPCQMRTDGSLGELMVGPLIIAADSNVAPDHLIDSRGLICGFWFPLVQFVSQPSHELVK